MSAPPASFTHRRGKAPARGSPARARCRIIAPFRSHPRVPRPSPLPLAPNPMLRVYSAHYRRAADELVEALVAAPDLRQIDSPFANRTVEDTCPHALEVTATVKSWVDTLDTASTKVRTALRKYIAALCLPSTVIVLEFRRKLDTPRTPSIYTVRFSREEDMKRVHQHFAGAPGMQNPPVRELEGCVITSNMYSKFKGDRYQIGSIPAMTDTALLKHLCEDAMFDTTGLQTFGRHFIPNDQQHAAASNGKVEFYMDPGVAVKHQHGNQQCQDWGSAISSATV